MHFELFGRLKNKGGSSKPPTHPPMTETHDTPSTSEPPKAPSKEPDLSQVSQMTQQGRHEAQVVEVLKAQGHDYKSIDNALNQNLRRTVIGEDQQETVFFDDSFTKQKSAQSLIPDDVDDSSEFLNTSATAFGQVKEDLRPLNYEVTNVQGQEETNEEYEMFIEEVEEVVDNLLEKRYGKMDEFKNEIKGQIEDILSRVTELETNLDDINTKFDAIDARVTKELKVFKTQLDEFHSKLDGIEKAFKDVIPSLVEGVKELQELMDADEVNLKRKEEKKDENLMETLEEDFELMDRKPENEEKELKEIKKTSKKKESKKDSKKDKNVDDFDYADLIN